MEFCLRYGTALTLLIQLVYFLRGKLSFQHLTAPLRKKHLICWLSIFNKWACIALTLFALHTTAIKLENTEASYQQWMTINWIFATVFALGVIPLRPRIDRSANLSIVAICCLLAYQLYLTQREPSPAEAVQLQAPFAEDFTIMSGGYSLLNSVLQSSSRAPRAFGVHMRPSKTTFLPESELGRPFPEAFGATILAPATGSLIVANESIPDLPMGQVHPDTGPGNYLILKIDQDHYLIFANLKQNSIRPKIGDTIQAGTPIAAIGKSGMFSEPVLLLIATNSPDIFGPKASSLPILLEGVQKIGSPAAKAPFFPTRNERYRPIHTSKN
jgi:hypothetical protein